MQMANIRDPAEEALLCDFPSSELLYIFEKRIYLHLHHCHCL